MNTFPGLVHTARHTTKVGNTRSRWPNPWEGAVEGGIGDWGEVVSKLRPSLVTVGEKLGYLLETPSIWRYQSFLRNDGEKATSADNQQGSRSSELSSGELTPQRLHAELLKQSFERLAKRDERKPLDTQLEHRMKI